ncbi:barstar family protein [Sphingomonas jeddahensis]|uniref:Barstar (Barnase inhibitor) n=1 Tax=Sphingomonas jeddahensis TaxID=1915074 RepID=A0A1V2EXF9_9SPHN|nr:barstar family protein [Sphingomonas jeddahensis]ONF96879.1 Barstar (barnase inhibitor) [Sphingomonas jeddahensis]
MPLTIVRLEAAGWETAADLWAALLPALGAPDWHGPSLDALFDSIVARLNRVQPPMVVELAGAACAGPAAVTYVTRIREVLEDAAREMGEQIELRVT